MASLKFLGRSGHTTVAFDILDEASLVAAKAEFDQARSQGAVTFAVKTPGAPAEQIKAFDPQVEEILVMSPMAGGAEA